MNIRKLSLIGTLILVNFFFTTFEYADARCSSTILRNVCKICEERATARLDTKEDCPPCEKINCPTASLACIQPDSFEPFLKTNYTLTKLPTDIEEEIYKITISKTTNIPGAFFYDIRYKNFRLATQKSVGFLIYDIVNFNLPVQGNESIFSYSCLGVIDNYSAIKGACTTLAFDESGVAKTYGFEFTALPNEVPIQ